MTIEDDKAEAAFENSIDPNIDRIADLEAENKRLRKQVDELIKQKRQLEADLRQL